MRVCESAAEARDSFTVTATTERASYRLGETLVVSAEARYENGAPVSSVRKTQIEIKDGARVRVVRDSLVSLGAGLFTLAADRGAADPPGH